MQFDRKQAQNLDRQHNCFCPFFRDTEKDSFNNCVVTAMYVEENGILCSTFCQDTQLLNVVTNEKIANSFNTITQYNFCHVLKY